MANKFARSNGDFNDASIWSGLAASMSATSVPTIGDNASANTFTIQITGNVACDNITNGTTYGGTAGGTFNLENNSQLTSDYILGTSLQVLLLSGTNSSTIVGNNIPANVSNNAITHRSSGTLNIVGSLVAGTGANASRGVFFVTGAVNGTLNVTGNVQGGTGSASDAIGTQVTGTVVNIVGNVTGNVGAGINNSMSAVTIVGSCVASSTNYAVNTSSTAAANVRISGNLIGAPNGIPAVYAASYTVNPVPYQTYIRYANNGTGVGSDAYLYHYTTDSLSAFSMPPVSAVRAGLQYADNTLTGTCQIPPVSSVAFGALVGNTTGTAILTSNDLWETSIASLTATNSVGAILKNSATVESVGRILASFTN
jgi:hypothetical protein